MQRESFQGASERSIGSQPRVFKVVQMPFFPTSFWEPVYGGIMMTKDLGKHKTDSGAAQAASRPLGGHLYGFVGAG